MKTNFNSFACVLLFTFLSCNSMLVSAQGDATFSIEKSFPGVSEIIGDDTGNIYIAGRFTSAVQIGDFNLVENDENNGVYVARLDNSGNPVWATSFSSSRGDFDNVFLAYFNSKIFLGGSSISEPFTSIVELDHNTGQILRTPDPLSPVWNDDQVPAPCFVVITSLDVDDTGIFITGVDTHSSCGWEEEGYVIKLDHNYNVTWMTRDGDGVSGNLIQAIPYSGSLSRTDDSFFTTGWMLGGTVFARKYSKTGDQKYGRYLETGGVVGFSDPRASAGRSIKSDSQGNTIVFGEYYNQDGPSFYNDETDFSLPTVGSGRDIFLTKFDSDGNLVWNMSFPGGGSERARDMVIDGQNYIYVTGDFSGTLNIGPYVLTSPPGNFIAKLDPNGNVVMAKRMNSSFDNLFVNMDRKIYVAGGGEFAELTYVPDVCDPCGQLITFNQISDKKFNDAPFPLVAHASSLLPVSFELISGPVELNGDVVTIRGTGDVVVKAYQSGNETYQPAPEVYREFSILKGDQTITFPPVSNVTVGTGPVALNGSSSSNLPITYFVSGPAIVAGGNIVSFGIGSVTVDAKQFGNENYNPATSVSRSFQINPTQTGETAVQAWFADADHDGFGNGNSTLVSCLPIPGYVQNNQDCDDSNPNIKPGGVEVQDGLDNNCNGQIDEGFATPKINDVILQAVCADYPSVSRRWKITNPNGVDMRIDWEITGSIQKSWIDVPPGDSYLTSVLVPKNPNTLRAYWHNEKGEKKFIEAQPNSSKCAKGSTSARVASESESEIDVSNNSAITVYPNPGNSMITLKIESDSDTEMPMQFISNNGSIYHQSNVRFSKGANFITQDISTMTEGMYTIKVGNKSIRFIKE